MRRGLILPVLFFVLTALPLSGGEYHTGETLVCSDCHSMHGSQSHTWSGTGTVATTGALDGEWLAPGAPNPALLKARTANATCLACHDGKTFAPDVLGPHGNDYVRQAGGLATASNGYHGHRLDRTLAVPGGYTSINLQCANCHNVHGSSAFRNTDAITYAKGTNNTTRDVFLRSFVVGDLANNYSPGNVDLNEPNTRNSKLGTFCRTCHLEFHGNSSADNMRDLDAPAGTGWVKHPTADANIGGAPAGHSDRAHFASHAYRVKVMSPAGDWGLQGSTWASAPANLTPTCTTCHRAHGNANPFALIYPTGTGETTEEGGGVYRDLCMQCHVQGTDVP